MAPSSPPDSADGRSPVALAYAWAWRVITISLEMVIPGLVGYGIDRWLGTKAAFVILGVLLGMALGMMHLMRIARSPPNSTK